MINLLLHWIGDWNDLFEDNNFGFYISTASVNEMKENVWMVGLQDADDFDALELAMESVNNVLVIGTYNKDGTQYLWGTEVSRNHTIQKYHAQLNNRKEYDEDGNVTVDVPYTQAEALTVQVNKFYGWTDRILN